jgi:hypothetical protein
MIDSAKVAALHSFEKNSAGSDGIKPSSNIKGLHLDGDTGDTIDSRHDPKNLDHTKSFDHSYLEATSEQLASNQVGVKGERLKSDQIRTMLMGKDLNKYRYSPEKFSELQKNAGISGLGSKVKYVAKDRMDNPKKQDLYVFPEEREHFTVGGFGVSSAGRMLFKKMPKQEAQVGVMNGDSSRFIPDAPTVQSSAKRLKDQYPGQDGYPSLFGRNFKPEKQLGAA